MYTPAAVACNNAISDASCQILYAAPDTLYPAAGNDAERALACYTTAAATPAAVVQDIKTAALASCAKTCGLCCQTHVYSCAYVAREFSVSITSSAIRCSSHTWTARL